MGVSLGPKMNRQLAIRILVMRRLLIQGLIERMLGRTTEAELAEARFRAMSDALPLFLHLDGVLTERIETPANRLLARRGVLGLREWAGVRRG